jgi:hypothetical protein
MPRTRFLHRLLGLAGADALADFPVSWVVRHLAGLAAVAPATAARQSCKEAQTDNMSVCEASSGTTMCNPVTALSLLCSHARHDSRMKLSGINAASD